MQGECKKASLLVFFAEPQPFLCKKCELEVFFNRYLVFRDAKCGICQNKVGYLQTIFEVNLSL